ncbi:Prefoldin subunit-domain-containing protein, partial [Limtongia smithiae]|uniref:Prefoldin subunit-domain-containing protein n=1 Tax=Limtongia smithiae TaxID=1125753 RepID=UPI0034CF8A70
MDVLSYTSSSSSSSEKRCGWDNAGVAHVTRLDALRIAIDVAQNRRQQTRATMSEATGATVNIAATKKQADLQAQYNTYKSTLQQLAQKIGELESEGDEHKLVLETLRPLPTTRKCFRMVGGVLVERTVGDVIPALEANATGVRTVLQQLVGEYKKTEEDMASWQKKNKVQVVQGP